ncbi:MAG: hypothetical protein WCU88_12945 [Elusimicrobiota bacterium]|jgi:hypothetical protein
MNRVPGRVRFGREAARWALTALALAAVAPLSRPLFSQPFFTDDHAIRFFIAVMNFEGFAYTPFSNAGYFIGHSMYFSSTGLWFLLFKVLRCVPPHVLYNGFHLAWLLAAPLLCRVLAVLFLDDREEQETFIDWLLPFILVSDMIFIYAGSFHWAVATYGVCVFFALCERPNIGLLGTLGLSLLSGLVFFINPLSIVPMAVFVLVQGCVARRMPWKALAALAAGLAGNIPAMLKTVPVLQGTSNCLLDDAYIAGPLLRRMLLLRFHPAGNFFLGGMIPAAGMLLAAFARSVRARACRPGVCGYSILALIAYVLFCLGPGGNFGVNQTPLRMVFVIYPLFLLMLIRCGSGLLRRWVFLPGLFFAAAFSLQLLLKGPLLPAGLPPDFVRLQDWIAARTDGSGRILLEEASHCFDSEGLLVHPLYGSHILPLLMLPGDRQYVSGVVPWVRRALYSRFWLMDGRLMDRPIEGYPLAELRRLFKDYNVRWIVCWTPESERYFSGRPAYLERGPSFGLFKTFTVREKYSFLEGADGEVRFSKDSAQVHLRGRSRSAVLKLHYLKSMRTQPPLAVSRAASEDPAGMVRIEYPAQDFTLYWE